MLHWSGPVIALLGVIVGAYGTLLMCRDYHPFGTWGPVVHLWWIMRKVFAGKEKRERIQEALKTASDLAKINSPNQTRTLAGVYVLVFSFLVQMVGAILILVDLHYTK